MNKKLLLLVASALVYSYAIADMSYVEAKNSDSSYERGAVVRQLSKDNTDDYAKIYEDYPQDSQIFERLNALIDYHDKLSQYKMGNDILEEIIRKINELPETQKTSEINKFKANLDEKLTQDPSPINYYRFYKFEMNFGSQDVAIDYLKEAMQLDPNNHNYKYEYAIYAMEHNDYEKAISLLENLEKNYPRNIYYRLAIAKAYSLAGNYDEAIKEYRIASSFDPADDDTIEAIYELSGLKMVQNAREQYKHNTENRPVASVDGQNLVTYKKNKNSSEITNKKDYTYSGAYVQNTNSNTGRTSGQNSLRNISSSNVKKQNLKIKETTYNNSGYNSNSKRVVVSYVNGKKVVKIVDMNSPEGTTDFEQGNSYSNINQNEQNLNYNTNLNNNSNTISSAKNEGREITQEKSAVSPEVKKEKKSFFSKFKKNDNKIENNQTTSSKNMDIYIKANELMSQSQYNEVITLLETVQPPTLRSLTSIASCYNALGQIDEAIEYYKKADKLSPENTQILYSIGYLYYTKNDIASAKKYVDLSLKADASNTNANELSKYIVQQESNSGINQAVSYMNQNKYSEAKKTLEKIITENPTDFQAYYYLGHIGYATQKYEDAARNFSMAIKYNPEYALSYYSIGLAFDKLKEFNKSRSAYEQFLQLENDDNKYTQYAKSRINTIKSKQ